MKEYVTVDEVDSILGVQWADPGMKDRGVLVANVWMTNQGLPELDPMPPEWKQAAAEIAREGAAGRVYGAVETGVLSKAVVAEGVSSSKTFSSTAKRYTAGESLARALLKPWLNSLPGTWFLRRA